MEQFTVRSVVQGSQNNLLPGKLFRNLANVLKMEMHKLPSIHYFFFFFFLKKQMIFIDWVKQKKCRREIRHAGKRKKSVANISEILCCC